MSYNLQVFDFLFPLLFFFACELCYAFIPVGVTSLPPPLPYHHHACDTFLSPPYMCLDHDLLLRLTM